MKLKITQLEIDADAEALRRHGPCGASRLAALVGGGVSSTAMYQRLLTLMAKGLIRKGDERGTFEVIDE